MRKYGIPGLLVLASIASWVPVLVCLIVFTISYEGTHLIILPVSSKLLLHLIYAVFIAVTGIAVAQLVRRIEKWDVIDLFWKILVIGIAGLSISFVFQILANYLQNDALYPVARAVSVSVNLYAMIVFLFSGMFIYKKLILYQKNKRKLISWRAFEVLMILAFLRLFMNPTWQVTQWMQTVILPVFLILGLFLSANVNWSAYLNFQQKLKTLFLIFIILLLFVAFFYTLPGDALIKSYIYLMPGEQMNPFVGGLLELNTSEFLFIGLLFLFSLLYSLFSGLVLIFNLPTSSVFEQRSSELASIQQINQSIQSNLDITEIFHTLLSGSLLTSNANAGWIEAIDYHHEDRRRSIPFSEHISHEEIKAISQVMDITQKVMEEKKAYHIRNLKKHKAHKYSRSRFRSLLALPIQSREKQMGVLYLVNELSGTFEDETILSLSAFAEQAAIAVENAELVRESISFERYREQLKIAKQVQEQILPKNMPVNGRIEFHAITQEVEEIGGDYYDVVKMSDTFYKVALGDVSGKGTTAAFYMAETKGVFQALTHLDMGVKEFAVAANRALSHCFSRGSFMTLTYLHIDLQKMQAEMIRLGHTPTLHYNAPQDKLSDHTSGGIGLGIVRDDGFAAKAGDPETVTLAPGDLIILYTDGIIEARNAAREEFGVHRLHDLVFNLRGAESRDIAARVLQKVKEFTGGEIEDDYTLLVIRIK